jgi:rhamnogalacturonyl hydrolase YesR
MFVLKDRNTGLYFAGWDTLGDNPWEVRAQDIGATWKIKR